MPDQKLTELTRLLNPSKAVRLYGVEDPGGTPAEYAIALAQLLGPIPPQMRLTLEQGVPVSTSDQIGKSTLYWCPYNGNAVWLFDGTLWRRFEMPEIALELSGLTSGKGYDTFAFTSSLVPSATSTAGDTLDFASAPGWATGSVCWVSATGGGLVEDIPYFLRAVDTDTYSLHSTLAGALANTGKVDITARISATIIAVSLELSAAWASATARTDALALQDGRYIKSGAASRLHLGGIYTTGTTTTEDAEDGRFLDNRYNQVIRHVAVSESTTSWVYTTQSYRYWNNNSANKIQVFSTTGVRNVSLVAGMASANSSATVRRFIAIGLDAASRSDYCIINGVAPAGSSVIDYPTAFFDGPIPLGLHYLSALEWSEASGATTWYGYGTSSANQMYGHWLC